MNGPSPDKTVQILWKTTLTAAIIIALISLVVSIRDSRDYPGGDLRCRVVGARLMTLERDPYSTAFQDDRRFTEPTWRKNGPTIPYTPSLLLFTMPICWVPYHTQRFIWSGLEWASLLLGIFLLTKLIPGAPAKRFFLICALLFFVASPFWRLHVERGQYYSFLLLLEILSLFILVRLGKAAWLFVVPLGWVATMRPSYVVAGLALFALGRWRAALTFFVTMAAFVGITLPFVGVQGWRQCFKVAEEIGYGMSSEAYIDQHFGTERVGTFTAEGAAFDGRQVDVRTTSFTLDGYVHKIVKAVAPRWVGTDMYTIAWESHIEFAVTLAVILLAIWLLRARLQNPLVLLLTCLTVMLYADGFVQVRFSYTDVLFLLPLALILMLLAERPATWLAMAVFLVGLILGSGYWSWMTPVQCERARPAASLAGIFLALAIQCLSPTLQHESAGFGQVGTGIAP